MKLKDYVEEQSKTLSNIKQQLEEIRKQLVVNVEDDEYDYLRYDCANLVALVHNGDRSYAEILRKRTYRISNHDGMPKLRISEMLAEREAIVNDLRLILELAELIKNTEEII